MAKAGVFGALLAFLVGLVGGCSYRKAGNDAGSDDAPGDRASLADSTSESSTDRPADGADASGTDVVADRPSTSDLGQDVVADRPTIPIDVGSPVDVQDVAQDRVVDALESVDVPRDSGVDIPVASDSGPPPLIGNGGMCQTSPQCLSNNCTGGICCAAGQSGCSGACYDLTRDNAHCGACTNVCALGKETCVTSTCRLNDGQPCTTPAQCVSGVCNLFFVDGDGDHYGTGAATSGFCNVPTPPVGFAAVGMDCCDSNPAVNPGVATFPTSPAPSCVGGSMVSPWDYNCDGRVESQRMTTEACVLPACATVPVDFPESACGGPLIFCFCQVAGTDCIMQCPSGGPPGSIQGCH